MVTGNPMDKIVVVEANDAWSFHNDISFVLQQEPSFYVSSTHVDAYMYKAILIKREIMSEGA